LRLTLDTFLGNSNFIAFRFAGLIQGSDVLVFGRFTLRAFGKFNFVIDFVASQIGVALGLFVAWSDFCGIGEFSRFAFLDAGQRDVELILG